MRQRDLLIKRVYGLGLKIWFRVKGLSATYEDDPYTAAQDVGFPFYSVSLSRTATLEAHLVGLWSVPSRRQISTVLWGRMVVSFGISV